MLVKTNPDAKPRFNGASLFITPKMQGFTVGRKLPEAGLQGDRCRGAPIFEDYRVPADPPDRQRRSRGFFQTTGGRARTLSIAASLTSARADRRGATEAAPDRKTFGDRFASIQAISSSSARWQPAHGQRAC